LPLPDGPDQARPEAVTRSLTGNDAHMKRM
jgi:hypothetical protein